MGSICQSPMLDCSCKQNEGKTKMETYCVVCSWVSDNGKNVCDTCHLMTHLPLDYVPTVCGDDVCYLDHQGQPNFDGDCDHQEMFYELTEVDC